MWLVWAILTYGAVLLVMVLGVLWLIAYSENDYKRQEQWLDKQLVGKSWKMHEGGERLANLRFESTCLSRYPSYTLARPLARLSSNEGSGWLFRLTKGLRYSDHASPWTEGNAVFVAHASCFRAFPEFVAEHDRYASSRRLRRGSSLEKNNKQSLPGNWLTNQKGVKSAIWSKIQNGIGECDTLHKIQIENGYLVIVGEGFDEDEGFAEFVGRVRRILVEIGAPPLLEGFEIGKSMEQTPG